LMISKGFLIHTQSLRLGLFLNQYRVVGNYRDGLLSVMYLGEYDACDVTLRALSI
jgi:hypothetical protein